MSRFVFVYGTLRRGFPNHGVLEEHVIQWHGERTTLEAFPLIVPQARVCTNPGCRFIHQMGVLCDLPGQGLHVEGDLFEVEDDALSEIDRLEHYDPKAPEESTYIRRTIRVKSGDGKEQPAECYFLADFVPFREMVDRGEANMVHEYELGMAQGDLKACCVAEPGHEGPHDIIALPALAP